MLLQAIMLMILIGTIAFCGAKGMEKAPLAVQANIGVVVREENVMTKMALSYVENPGKAAQIYVEFVSSGHPDWNTRNKDWFEVPSFGNLSDGKFQGSSLFIDDIVLNY